MKTYSIDHAKISKAVKSLNSAESLMTNDCIDAAQERIEEARKLLQEFMNQENLVEDDDLADGLIKQSESFDDDQLDFIRDLFAEQMHKARLRWDKALQEGDKHALQQEELAIINVCQAQLGCDEFESVDQFYRNKSNTRTEIRED